jgi:hypothetical protein
VQGYQCAYPGGACTWDDKVLSPSSSTVEHSLI